MARVPTYSERQVEAGILPGVKIESHAGDYRAGQQALARRATDVADTVARFAMQEQEKANDAALMAFKNELSQVENELLYDPDSGAFTKKGSESFTLGQTVMPAWDKRQSEAIGRLPRHLQGRASELANASRANAEQGIMRHVMRETDAYRDQQADAMVVNATDSARKNAADPARFGEELANVDAAITMKMRGAAPEVIETARMEARSGVLAAVFDDTINTDPNAAADWLASNRGGMTAEHASAAESKLQPIIREQDAGMLVESWLRGEEGAASGVAFEGAAQTPDDVVAVARASVGRTVGLESGGKANAKNPNSSATGAGQFIESTWIDVLSRNRPDIVKGKSRAEILALRTDPTLSKAMTEAYAIENCMGLFKSGLPVTPQTAYLGHHFGLDGARKLLRAAPNTPVRNVLSAKDYAANSYLHGKTVGQLIANHERRAGGQPTAQVAPPPRLANGDTDWATLEERANTLSNPMQRRAVLGELQRRQGVESQRRQQEDRVNSEAVYVALNRAPVGASLKQALSAAQIGWLEKSGKLDWARGQLDAKLKDVAPKDDVMLVESLEREAFMSPGTFIKRNLMTQAGMTEQTRTRLLKMQKEAGDPGKRADWSSTDERITRGAMLLGIDDASVGTGTKQRDAAKLQRATFANAYRLAEDAFITKTGKKPDATQAEVLLKQVVQNFAANGGRGVDEASAYAPGVRNQISPGDYAAVRDVLVARGNKNPTDADIRRAVADYYSRNN